VLKSCESFAARHATRAGQGYRCIPLCIVTEKILTNNSDKNRYFIKF